MRRHWRWVSFLQFLFFVFLCGYPPPVTHLISVIFVLQKNTTLKELKLGLNKIGDEGGKAIGKALEVSFVLVSFFSFFGVVTPSPVTLVVYFVILVLQENKTLEILWMVDNKIGDVGTTALAKAIEVSPVCSSFLSLLSAVTTLR